MKLLVFIDFTAFCAGKKKKPPHISPQVCPVSNGSHGCQQIPNPFLLRWEGHTGGQHVHVQQLQQTRLGGVLARDGLIWKDFWKGFLSWTTENFDSGTERAFNTPYSENRRLGLGFARWFSANGNSNLCWGIIVLWQILLVAIGTERINRKSTQSEPGSPAKRGWTSQSIERSTRPPWHWQQNYFEWSSADIYPQILSNLETLTLQVGIYSITVYLMCVWKIELTASSDFRVLFFLSPGWCVMMYPFWVKSCSTMSTRDLQRSETKDPCQCNLKKNKLQ